MTWHLGYPLSQTLFTCVYVEALLMPKPREIDEARFIRGKDISAESGPMLQILRAYCLGMLKVCGCVNERVRSEHYYEVDLLFLSGRSFSHRPCRRRILSPIHITET